MATIKLREYISCRREYEMEVTDADAGQLNLDLLQWATEPFETITCEDIIEVYNGNWKLGSVQLKGRKYRTDLNEFVREWFDEELWNTDCWESDWDTDDVEREGCL